jgi:hypothetical protein
MVRVAMFDVLVVLTHLRGRGELCESCDGRGRCAPELDGGGPMWFGWDRVVPHPSMPRRRILCSGCGGVGRLPSVLDERSAEVAAARFHACEFDRVREAAR